jgi:hypothetical protein
MNKRYPLSLLLACLSIVLIAAAACVPPPAPVPPTATPSNTITNIVWQWTSVTNKPTGETTAVSNPQNYTITFRDDGTLSAVVAGGPDGQGNLALENAGGEKRMLFVNGGAAPAQ